MKHLLTIVLFSFLISCSADKTGQLKKDIVAVTSSKNATVGVAFMPKGNNKIISINNEHKYPMMSVFKFHLSLAVCNYLDKNNLPLSTEIFIDKTDLMHNTYSPLRDKYPEGGISMSIGEMLQYTVSLSDNNTCDILIKYIGGVKVFEEYIKSLGVRDVQIAITEREMQDAFDNQYQNWTSPEAAVELLNIFFERDLFAKDYKDFLIKTMIETKTGANKIKALLPSNVIVGHKTGSSHRSETGIQAAENDIAFIQLPDGKQYYLAVFVTDSTEDDKTNAAIIAEISKIVYEYFSKQ